MKRVLTGITTSGTPHIGNYVGAIRPAIAASRSADVESFYFLADLHALIKTGDPARVARSTLEIAATWLALGLDPARVFFYRQSDIPEIPELTWFLTCVTPKGLLNRAHAYKAATDANERAGENPEDADAGITAGLYMYPVLMAADILLFKANKVPVGRDQIQHIEIARDIAQRFNHLYDGDYFTLPEAQVDEATAILPGLDGRKMSKSYDNVIPLWDEPGALERKIMGIVTNSQASGEPKSPDDSALYTIWQAFATPDECADMRRRYAEGIGWGEVKRLLAARINAELAPSREEYQRLIADPVYIEHVLREGAGRARQRVAPFLAELRAAVGLWEIGKIRVKGVPTGSVGVPGFGQKPLGDRDELGTLFDETLEAKLEQLRPTGKPIPLSTSATSSLNDGKYSFAITLTDGSHPMIARSVLFESQLEADHARQHFNGPGLRNLVVMNQPAEDGRYFIRIVVDEAGEQEVVARVGTYPFEQASKAQDLARQSIKLAIRAWESTLPQFKIFREKDGSFRLKFVDAAGKDLAESVPLQTNQAARQLRDSLLRVDPFILKRDARFDAPCDGGCRFILRMPAEVPVMQGPVVPTERESLDAYTRFEAALRHLSQ